MLLHGSFTLFISYFFSLFGFGVFSASFGMFFFAVFLSFAFSFISLSFQLFFFTFYFVLRFKNKGRWDIQVYILYETTYYRPSLGFSALLWCSFMYFFLLPLFVTEQGTAFTKIAFTYKTKSSVHLLVLQERSFFLYVVKDSSLLVLCCCVFLLYFACFFWSPILLIHLSFLVMVAALSVAVYHLNWLSVHFPSLHLLSCCT